MTGLVRLFPTPLPCRFCHRPSYLAEADDEKRLHPLHPCCAYWIGQLKRPSCVACAYFNSRRKGRAGKLEGPELRPEKDFDEDEGLLLVLALLRETKGWVALSELLPLVGGRGRLLNQLVNVGVKEQGSWFKWT